MQIHNLTPYQVELLDAMWACNTYSEYQQFYDMLDPEDQLLADSLQRLVVMEAIDESMEQQKSFPEANSVIDRFKK